MFAVMFGCRSAVMQGHMMQRYRGTGRQGCRDALPIEEYAPTCSGNNRHALLYAAPLVKECDEAEGS